LTDGWDGMRSEGVGCRALLVPRTRDIQIGYLTVVLRQRDFSMSNCSINHVDAQESEVDETSEVDRKVCMYVVGKLHRQVG
jgi:hypothetical protein